MDGIFAPTHRARTVCFAAVTFLTGFAALAVLPTLPTATADLHGVALFPLVAGCFVAASLLGGVLGGAWSDAAGARAPLAVGTVLTVATLLVSASSTSIWQLAAGRFLDGLAAGAVAVAINAAIGQSYPEHLQSRVLALMSGCWVIPSLVGPPLAGLVSELWSWRVVFYGLAVLTAVPSLLLVLVLRRQDGPPRDPGPAARPPLLVAVVVSLAAAVGQYGVSGRDARHLLAVVAAGALLAAFAPRLLPTGTWRAVRGLPATVLLRGLSSGTFFTLEAYVPLLLITERHVNPVVSGLAFTGAALAWAGASWVQGNLLHGVPRHRTVLIGTLVMAAAVACAVLGTLPGLPALTAAPAMPLAATGMGLLSPALTVLSLAHSPAGHEGRTSSAMQTNQNLGQITVLALASLALTAGASSLSGYAAAFTLLAAPLAALALLAPRTRIP
ncbi:MFS transporter [Kitasatospora sp. NPDC088391]|uniref:MFS transporter n=1 Tax=Kitasatospora sp. NPDC088391 TaxID=3364074 RepID=UPI00382DB451